MDKIVVNLAPSPVFQSCEAVGYHPGPCLPYHAHDLTLNFISTAKMYLPIYILPQVVFKLDAIKTR